MSSRIPEGKKRAKKRWIAGGLERLESVRDLCRRAVEVPDGRLHLASTPSEHRGSPQSRTRFRATAVEDGVPKQSGRVVIRRDRCGEFVITLCETGGRAD